jgi:DNA-binding response OmpR family regulator
MRTVATRILVIEDDELLREALEASLSRDGFEVRPYEHGLAMERDVRREVPDLVVLDLNLPIGPDGIVLTRRLRAMGDIPVVVISGSSRVEDRLAAFEAGADDFLVKPFATAELRARIEAVLRRSDRRAKRVLQVGDVVVDVSAHLAQRAGSPLSLRHIEFQLLETFCRHPGQVLSKVQLLEKVWGYAFADVNLVEVHVSHLRRELERAGPRVIHTVRSVGYVLQPDRLVPPPSRREVPDGHDVEIDLVELDRAVARATGRQRRG